MNVEGFALVRKSDAAQLQKWRAVPARIELFDGDTCLLRIDAAQAGWENETYSVAAVSWTEPDPVPYVPQIISDRQFFQQLAIQSVITQDEALAAVGPGTIPAALVTLVASLPAEQQFAANMLLKGATQFDRQHPMVAVLGQGFGWNDAQLDALWTAATLL